MILTIGPLVQVAKRQWLISTGLFVIASLLGGGAFFALVGALGAPIFGGIRHRETALGALAVLLALVELRLLPIPVPTLYRSVPQDWWLDWGPTKAAVAYGGVLGMGVATFNPFASFYFLLAVALIEGPLAAGLLGLSYGFGRAVTVVISSLAITRGASARELSIWAAGSGRQMARMVCAFTLLALAASSLLNV